jgi:hypothetical protein
MPQRVPTCSSFFFCFLLVPGSASWATQKAFPDPSTPTALRRAWTPKQGPGKSTQTNVAGARAGEKQKDPEATAKAVPANSAAPCEQALAVQILLSYPARIIVGHRLYLDETMGWHDLCRSLCFIVEFRELRLKCI